SHPRARRPVQKVLPRDHEGVATNTSSATGVDQIVAWHSSYGGRRMTPLALATWMMTQFGVEDSLIGDSQEMSSRSSMVGVWLQAAGAIVVGIRQDFGAHWVLAIRAAVFGMFVWKLLFPTVSTVLWHFTT